MKKFALLLAVLALLGSVMMAQTSNNAPATSTSISKYVWVEHSQVNPAHADAYNRVIREYREAAATSGTDVRWIAASSITGDGGQFTYITFHDSLASVDAMQKAFGDIQHQLTVKNASFATEAGESETSSHSVLAKYRDDISYKPEAIDGPQVTRWRVTTYRIKPGYGSDFEDFEKQVAELHAKANDNAHWIAYQIMAGEEGPAYVIVTPLRSLADLDEPENAASKEVFSPIVHRQFSAFFKEAVKSFSTQFLAAEPTMSRPPENYIASNPDFWSPKEEATTNAGNRTPRRGRKSASEPASQQKEETPKQ